MFLHGHFLHLFGNMVYLYIFGDNIEDAFGSSRYLIFYILCGIIADITHILSLTNPRDGQTLKILKFIGNLNFSFLLKNWC